MRSDHVRVIVAVLWLPLLAALVACTQQVTPPGNELIGGVNDPVEEAIPSLAFVPREDDYTEDHPDLPGVPLSFNTLVLVFEQGTTVGEAQALLDDIEAEIVGGIPGVNGEAEGILFLRVPTADHQAMIDLLVAAARQSAGQVRRAGRAAEHDAGPATQRGHPGLDLAGHARWRQLGHGAHPGAPAVEPERRRGQERPHHPDGRARRGLCQQP